MLQTLRRAALVVAAMWVCYALAPAVERVQAQQFGGTTYCNSSVVFDATPTSGTTRLVAGAAATGSPGSIYICGYTISSPATVNVKLVQGTQVATACDTGQTAITPVYQFKATSAGIAAVADDASNWRGMDVNPGNDLCINISPTSQTVQAIVYFYQQR